MAQFSSLFARFRSQHRTLRIPVTVYNPNMTVNKVVERKYPAKAHARRILDHISAKTPLANGYIFLSGCPNKFYQDCDLLIPFRQRRAFMYMSGVNIADCHLLYEIDSDRLTLFLPPVDPDNILWEGTPLTPEEALATYDVDAVLQNTALSATLESIRHRGQGAQHTIFTIAGHVENEVTFPKGVTVDSTALGEAINECRVVKDEYEIELLQKANDISSAAHKAIMKVVGKSQNEAEIEAVFLGECTKRGARIQAYPSIVASGRAAATMHPESNSQSFYAGGKRKDVLLIDAGAEWECYGADITRTLPISGKFTQEGREIYEIVLKMQEGCIAVLKEGVLWDDVHILAHKIAIDGLLSLGIMRGDRDEILAARTSAAFFPHGLGHFLGMDTHDTGGRPDKTERDPIFQNLKVRRRLPAGCVVTVEPGIHFNEYVVNKFLKDPVHSKYINEDILNRYWDVGGVCIEDDILVTVDGNVNLTDLPKDLEMIEKIVSRG